MAEREKSVSHLQISFDVQSGSQTGGLLRFEPVVSHENHGLVGSGTVSRDGDEAVGKAFHVDFREILGSHPLMESVQGPLGMTYTHGRSLGNKTFLLAYIMVREK